MVKPLAFGSLFAGIGGMDLGLERAGLTCKWQVEIEPHRRRVLAKHWPTIPKHDDVRTFPPVGEWGVDLIAGGFPCQDISNAGNCVGITGERSGLWVEYARIIRTLRPRYVLVENVAALLVRGIDTVLGDLAGLGYDAEWSVLSACRLGAPHMRRRLFILANRREDGRPDKAGRFPCRAVPQDWYVERRRGRVSKPARHGGVPVIDLDAWHDSPSEFCGMADGLPDWMDRISGLGNAVVPQVAEWIGRRVMAVEAIRMAKA